MEGAFFKHREPEERKGGVQILGVSRGKPHDRAERSLRGLWRYEHHHSVDPLVNPSV